MTTATCSPGSMEEAESLPPHRQIPGQTGQGIRLWKKPLELFTKTTKSHSAGSYLPPLLYKKTFASPELRSSPGRRRQHLVTILALPTISFTNLAGAC